MEYEHRLTDEEINTDTLIFYSLNLPPDAQVWFRNNANRSIKLYSLAGDILRRNTRVEQRKKNIWQLKCGINTFQDISPNDTIRIKSRLDGNLEIDIAILQSTPFPSSTLNRQSRFKPVPMFTPSNRAKIEIVGEEINFRGLRHAPVNEQGVVFLFGMICEELGFRIDTVQSPFPDCIGLRRINLNPERWERIYIEFEYRSKNFKEHKHNPDECDLIVCWEHNWHDCTLDVLILKDEIKRLKAENGNG